jgi:hypothetical protein
MAEGRRQRAEGRGQKVEGRRKKEEGRGQRAEGRGQKVEGRRKKEEGKVRTSLVSQRNASSGRGFASSFILHPSIKVPPRSAR